MVTQMHSWNWDLILIILREVQDSFLLLDYIKFGVFLVVNNPPANVGDMGSIPRSERYPEEENGNSLKYACLGNPWIEEPNGYSP